MTLETIDLREYWRILVRRRWAIYLVVVAFGLLSLIGSFLTTPQYKATATLQIDRYNPDILDVRDVARTDFTWSAFDHFFETQYQILSSAPVARIAAERLELQTHSEFGESSSGPGLWTRIKALVPRKRGVAVESDPLDRATRRVMGGLDVVPVRNSYLVEVSWIHADPVLAADVANAVSEAYIEFSLESRYSTTDQAREFLVEQIGTLKQEITSLEQRLQEYAESKNIVSVDDSNNLTVQALRDLSAQRTAAGAALAKAKAAFDAARDATPESLPEVLNSSLIARLRTEYAAYEAEYSEKAESFKDAWPGMQTLKSKLEQAGKRLDLETARIVEQVRATAEAEYLKALEESTNLDQLLKQYENSAQQLKRDAVEYNNLLSDVRKKREALDALLRRQNEMALSTRLRSVESHHMSNIRIVQGAEPPAVPFLPNTRKNVGVGLLLGLALGAALAFLLEHLDNSINSPTELQELLSLPLLATIPRYGESPAVLSRVRRRRPGPDTGTIDLVAHREGHAMVTEAYRSLRTSILLSNPGHPPRLISLTSALPEEGKTATAINLAVVLAQLGDRVLLVDTDLRRPRLHKALRAPNDRGVSTYLSGLERDPARLVVPTGIDNLDLMPSGPVPPNPSELLNSPCFPRLGAELLECGYAHLLFDSPPVMSVSDPVIVASGTETGILVVRTGQTPRQTVRLAAERLAQTGRPFGVVLNGYDPVGPGAAYDGYHSAPRRDPPSEERDADPAKRASGA